MSEMVVLLETMVAEVEAGRSVALCVIVSKKGSAPQVPGAAMVVRADGVMVGTVGGGISEAQVRDAALVVIRENRAQLLDLLLDHDCSGEGASICGGRVSVIVTPFAGKSAAGVLKTARDNARRHQPAQLLLRVTHQGRDIEYRLSVETMPKLLMAGAGHVGQAVAYLARQVGFRVVVFDDRADFASADRLPPETELIVYDIAEALRQYPIDGSCYVVIATRGHVYDREALEAVIARPAAYIGMIGSQRKSAAVLKALADAGIASDRLEQVHTPIGLPIGALTVNEIAVSILAEMIQTRRRVTPKVITGPFELSA
ncbi:MAG: XdhC family protein [Planctomycetota bacterium]